MSNKNWSEAEKESLNKCPKCGRGIYFDTGKIAQIQNWWKRRGWILKEEHSNPGGKELIFNHETIADFKIIERFVQIADGCYYCDFKKIKNVLEGR